MGDFLNWMTLFGLGLIAGGATLMTIAIRGANQLRPAHRRGAWGLLGRAETAPPPQIRPSALLADTVSLEQIGSRPKPGDW